MAHQDFYLLNSSTYDDYLDTFVNKTDLKNLRKMTTCRKVVSLGYRTKENIMTPDEFRKYKKQVTEQMNPAKVGITHFSAGIHITDPVLIEMAIREAPNMQKTLATIIFIKLRSPAGFEKSAYIDFSHNLHRSSMNEKNSTDWKAVYRGIQKLSPLPRHLSYFNWRTGEVAYNSTDNFMVMHDAEQGLGFQHKGDHLKICVGRHVKNCSRLEVFSNNYGRVVFYDHVVRRKT